MCALVDEALILRSWLVSNPAVGFRCGKMAEFAIVHLFTFVLHGRAIFLTSLVMVIGSRYTVYNFQSSTILRKSRSRISIRRERIFSSMRDDDVIRWLEEEEIVKMMWMK